MTQHLAGSGRGGGVAGCPTGAPRCRGLRPGPCLLLEVDGALHRTVALQHAHSLHRHALPGHALGPPEPEEGEKKKIQATPDDAPGNAGANRGGRAAEVL